MCDPRAISCIALGLEIEKSQRRTRTSDNDGLMERRKRLTRLLDTFRDLQDIYMPGVRDLLPRIEPYVLPEYAMVLLPSALTAEQRGRCASGLIETEITLRQSQCVVGRARLENLSVRLRRLVNWGKKWGAASRTKNQTEMDRIERSIREERHKLDDATAALVALSSAVASQQQPPAEPTTHRISPPAAIEGGSSARRDGLGGGGRAAGGMDAVRDREGGGVAYSGESTQTAMSKCIWQRDANVIL
ncbi:hypothetical protein C8R43DRAFT_946004 [Mycena crocata]|nr:hypothetical protein C8R43DRAFT_946004 [Mycena crocata]